MAVFESKTPWKTRKDCKVEDIAPNIRYVHMSDLHSATVTIPTDEVEAFREWCVVNGLKPTEHVYNGPTAQFIFMLIPRERVMLIKLAWGRYD
jgi:hypothetical protein